MQRTNCQLDKFLETATDGVISLNCPSKKKKFSFKSIAVPTTLILLI